MSNIPIRDIPGGIGTPTEDALVAMDNGVTMQKTTARAITEAGRPAASKAEAEAGEDNRKVMTPLRVAEAIASQSISPTEVQAVYDARDVTLNAADAAAGSAGTAVGAAGTAQTSAGQAMAFRNAAEGFRNAAEDFATNAGNAAARAEEAAQDVEGVAVVVENLPEILAAPAAASTAVASATTASTQANRAEGQADRAELAAGNAAVNADVYPDIATGRAAVADGGQFQVLVGDEYVRYRRDSSSTQTEVGRYPSSTAVDKAVENTDKKIDFTGDGTAIFHVVDDDMNVMAVMEGDGELLLTGMEGSVQSLARHTGENNDVDVIEYLLDADGMVMRKQTADGSFYLPGLSRSIQGEIENLKEAPTQRAPLSETSRERLSPVVVSSFVTNMGKGGLVAPLPLELYPSDYDIGDEWLGNASFITAPGQLYIPLTTPYNVDDGVVHPHIIEIPDTFRGFRYLMVITPYPGMDDQKENPVVYGSNDLETFDMLSDMPQPLAEPPTTTYGGYNYDPFFTYDPATGDLVCVWATVELQSSGGPAAGLKCLYIRRTKDGIVWTDAEQITEKTTESERSACILFNANDGYYYMYYTPNANELAFKRSRTLSADGWSERAVIDTSGLGRAFWHLECKCVGNRVVVLFNDFNSSGNLYWGVSSPYDWTKFTYDPTPVISDRSSIVAEYGAPGVSGAYKASFIPQINGNAELRFRIAWTPAGSIGLGRKLFINSTEWIEV